jgi:transposase
MISYSVFCRLRELYDQKHLSVVQIADELQVNPKTVAKWVGQPNYLPRRKAKRSSKLNPFKGHIVSQLERHPYTAQQLLQQIKAQGYLGGYSILKAFVHLVRPVRKPAFLTLEFAAGECAQVDWGSFGSITVGSTRRRLSFFVMVLCYSRMLYLEFTLSEGMEQFLSCHRHALEFFGGVPAKIMLDNLKTGVLEHLPGMAPRFNPRYLDFAAHYGFIPVACQVGKANEKGRVENGVGYAKKNFLNGLELPAFSALNPAACQWRDTVANVRIHGETRVKPIERFVQEKPLLRPLPAIGYDCALIRSTGANGCCRVVLDTNRYTVPYLYASQKLTLKLYPDQLLLYHNQKHIATHLRCYDRHQDVRNPDHIRELLVHRHHAREQSCLQAFLSLGPQAELYLSKLQQKRLNVAHHIQKIVALSQLYDADKVVRALGDALHFEAYGCEYIANLLEQRERKTPAASPLHLTHQQDLLELELPPANLDLYQVKPPTNPQSL